MARRILRIVRDLWLMLGVLAILLGLAELLAETLHLGQPTPFYYTSDLRYRAEPDLSWARAYYAELDEYANNPVWADYTHFTGRPSVDGKYLHVDDAGHRRTIQPDPGARGDRAKAVRIFGGSTVWGWSQRDEHTIPSELARGLARAGLAAQVENDGQISYQSTQETIELLRQLGSGRPVPDLVVFLDGFNDVNLALEQGRAGLSELHDPLANDFLLRRRPADLFDRLIKKAALRRAFFHQRAPRALSLAEQTRLADDIALRYATNVRAVEGLAKRFGFRALFFWQPLAATKKRLTRLEEETKVFEPRVALNLELFRLATDKVRAMLASDADFHDLSGLFADEPETVYTDFVHYTEAAAARVAERLRVDVEPALR